MKFSRKLSSCPSAVSAFVPTVPASFVATDLKRVVFEVVVSGRVDSADITVTRGFGDTPRLTAVLKFHDEAGIQHQAVAKEQDSTPARMLPKGLFLGRGLTAQNIILWALYGICMIISSIR